MKSNKRNIFFTSDLHIGHENVIKFDNRPFSTIDEMDNELIKRWNNKVKSKDLVYIIGDFIWKTKSNEAVNIIKSLNGEKILIRGNHDTLIKRDDINNLFVEVKDYDDICVSRDDGTNIRCILSHYFIPFYNGHRRNAVLLHGHSHITEESNLEREIVSTLNNRGFNIRAYNVGCMYWNYEPVTIDEILSSKDKGNT